MTGDATGPQGGEDETVPVGGTASSEPSADAPALLEAGDVEAAGGKTGGPEAADGPEAATGASRARRAGLAAIAIAVYAVLAGLVYGLHPPATNTTLPPCACGDISSQVWFIAWPAYALAHGHNPLYSSWVDYPHGVNLMSNTAMPLLGIVFAPVTWLLGPLSSFSLLMRLAFALSGTSMYFLLRRWTSWWPAAALGGLLYEFCPYMVGQSQSHLFLTFVPLPPIMVILLDKIVVERSHLWRNGILLGLVLAAQLMISAEVLAMCLLAAVGGLVVMGLRHPVAARERAGDLLRAVGAAALAFVVLAGYPLWIYFKGPYHVSGPPHPVAELDQYHSFIGSLWYPTTLQKFTFGSWLSRGLARVQGNGVEHTTYLGIAMLVVLAFIFVRCIRDGRVLLFSLVAFLAWVITLGRGKGSVKLPYDLLVKVPVVNGALDLRYSLLMYLGVAVVFAIGLDRMRREGVLAGFWRRPAAHDRPPAAGRARANLVVALVAAAAALVPLVPALPYASTASGVPALFGEAGSPLKAGSVVLSFPLPISYEGPNDQALLWQAASDMRFKLIAFRGAVAGPSSAPIRGANLLLPPYEAEQVLVWGLYGEPKPPPENAASSRAIEIFLNTYNVDAVTVVPSGPETKTVISYYTEALHTAPLAFEGTWIWPDVKADLARLGFSSTG